MSWTGGQDWTGPTCPQPPWKVDGQDKPRGLSLSTGFRRPQKWAQPVTEARKRVPGLPWWYVGVVSRSLSSASTHESGLSLIGVGIRWAPLGEAAKGRSSGA